MLQALALAGLSAGGSFLSGMGASQASAKQSRLQQIETNEARRLNEEQQNLQIAYGERLGRELLTIKETHTEEQENSSGGWVDVDAMMAASERAGFNPVTFLNAGALQAYTMGWSRTKTTKTSEGHNAEAAFRLMMPDALVTQPGVVPQQSNMLQAAGGALSAGASAFGTQLRADQSYDVQMARLLAAQGLNGMGLSQGNGLTTAVSYGGQGGLSAGFATPAGGLSTSSKVSDLPYPQNWKVGDVEVTNPWGRGFIDSTAPNAEAAETRYGDVGQELVGAANFIADAYRNAFGMTLRETGKAAGLNIGDYKAPSDTSWGPAFGRWWNSPTSLPSAKLPGFSGAHEGGYFPFPGSSPLN